jgi:hypothetical protein
VKIIISAIIILLLTGCITMNHCPYCGEKDYPEYARYEKENLGHGIIRETKWRGWVHVYEEEPTPNGIKELK